MDKTNILQSQFYLYLLLFMLFLELPMFLKMLVCISAFLFFQIYNHISEKKSIFFLIVSSSFQNNSFFKFQLNTSNCAYILSIHKTFYPQLLLFPYCFSNILNLYQMSYQLNNYTDTYKWLLIIISDINQLKGKHIQHRILVATQYKTRVVTS